MVSSTESENDVANWILDQNDWCKGPYVISDSKIEFWVKTEFDLLETRFKDKMEDNMLRLNLRVWSSNNEFSYEDIFTFNLNWAIFSFNKSVIKLWHTYSATM